LKRIFLHRGIRDTVPGSLGCFFSTCIALPFLDHRVLPEALGIVMDKKLLNT